MNISNFFQPEVLFDIYTGPWQQYGFFVFIACMVIFSLGIVIRIVCQLAHLTPVYKRLLTKVSVLLITLGAIAVFLWFARQQYVPIFSARFWWLILLISAIVWLFYISRNVVRFKKNKQQYLERKKVYTDYLPSKK